MDTPETIAEKRKAPMSAEAIIGIATTVGGLGFLFLMLGFAQLLRHVPAGARVFMPIGAVLLVLGIVTATFAKRRR